MSTDSGQVEDLWRASSGTSGDSVAVGGSSTDVIPRVWAERILGQLREAHPAIWRRLLGHASTGGS
jgi:hypothetical protein